MEDFVNVYTYNRQLTFTGESYTTLKQARKQIIEYENKAYLAAAGYDKCGYIIYAVEEIDFDRQIINAIYLFEPYMAEQEEVVSLLRENDSINVHFLISENREPTVRIRHIRPCTLKTANEFVKINHRHNAPVTGCKFAISLTEENEEGEDLVGVVIAGRPVSRFLDDGRTLEVTRLAVTSADNSCSELYAAAARAAQAMGYERIVTYTLSSESGRSLLSAGFSKTAVGCGGEWSGKRAEQNRLRNPEKLIPTEKKVRWERILMQKTLIVKGR